MVFRLEVFRLRESTRESTRAAVRAPVGEEPGQAGAGCFALKGQTPVTRKRTLRGDGMWVTQAFCFELGPTRAARVALAKHVGAARLAYNWMPAVQGTRTRRIGWATGPTVRA